MNVGNVTKLPQHLAIIMDGNGRWAQQRGLPRIAGHQEGFKRAKEIVEAVGKQGIPYLSLFVFSTENWKRPNDEVAYLMKLLNQSVRKEFRTLMDNDVKLVLSGRLQGLPGNLEYELTQLARETGDNSGLVLNLAINYGGRAEIVDAVKKISQHVLEGKMDPDQIDEALFSQYLYTPELPPVDLIVRPSGEKRISNFMLWQGAYAELVTLDTYWPSFTEQHLEQALEEYARRERRFGGLAQ